MFKSIIVYVFECDKSLEQNHSIVLLATFLISYIIFNFMFKNKKDDTQNFSYQQQKQQIAENYLKNHEKEDREFFTGEVEED